MFIKILLYEWCTSEISVLKMNYFFTENGTSSLPGDKINFWREKLIILLFLTNTLSQLPNTVLGLSLSCRDRNMPVFLSFTVLKLYCGLYGGPVSNILL